MAINKKKITQKELPLAASLKLIAHPARWPS
jgi:hypothetical protein